MDLPAHAMFGALLCSQSGLAGGGKVAAMKWYRDRTVHLAIFFSLLPDMVSMWIPFILHAVSGPDGIFFHHYDGRWLIVYRLAHSLLPALTVTALLLLRNRGLAIASLAWPVHVVCDSLTHGGGKWKTMFFYPLSEWGVEGVRFWEEFWVAPAYWLVIALLMAVVVRIRRAGRATEYRP